MHVYDKTCCCFYCFDYCLCVWLEYMGEFSVTEYYVLPLLFRINTYYAIRVLARPGQEIITDWIQCFAFVVFFGQKMLRLSRVSFDFHFAWMCRCDWKYWCVILSEKTDFILQFGCKYLLPICNLAKFHFIQNQCTKLEFHVLRSIQFWPM